MTQIYKQQKQMPSGLIVHSRLAERVVCSRHRHVSGARKGHTPTMLLGGREIESEDHSHFSIAFLPFP